MNDVKLGFLMRAENIRSLKIRLYDALRVREDD